MSGILNSLYDNVSYALGRHGEAMLYLQEQTTTGSRINRVSDDPSTAQRLMLLDTQASNLNNYVENLADTINIFETSSTTIQSMSDELLSVRQLLIQIAGGVYGEDNRQRIADGIDDHLEQVVQLANAKHISAYLFGGDKTASVPYEVTRDENGSITAVTYQGSDAKRQVQTAPGVNTGVFLVGSEVFQSDNRSTPAIALGNTGVAIATGSGSGTSSVTGDVWLTATDNGSSFDLSINGGTAVDLSAVSDLSNVALKDADGKVLYVDASGSLTEGTDLIRVPGTYDVFEALISARDILRNTRSLPASQLSTAIEKASDTVSEVSEKVLQSSVSLGLTTGFLYDLKDQVENQAFKGQEEADGLSQADVAQLAVDLSRRQVLYQMSLSVAGKLMQVSLLDYIR